MSFKKLFFFFKFPLEINLEFVFVILCRDFSAHGYRYGYTYKLCLI